MKCTANLTVAIALLLSLCLARSVSAYTFTLSDAAGLEGSPVNVSLSLTVDATDATLVATDFNVNFDHNLLAYNGFIPTPLGGFPMDNTPSDEPLRIYLVGLDMEHLGLKGPGTFELGELLFTALSDVPSTTIQISDALYGTVDNNMGGDMTPVPEPSSIVLAAAGLVSLIALRRRSG